MNTSVQSCVVRSSSGKGLAYILKRIQALMPVLALPGVSGGAQALC